MSLVTRGLGSVPRLVTAGLGGSFVFDTFTVVITRGIELATIFTITTNMSDLTTPQSLKTEFLGGASLNNEFSRLINTNTESQLNPTIT